MKMPYKSLKSQNLNSLVTIIGVVTNVGYVGLTVSILDFFSEVLTDGAFDYIDNTLLPSSIFILFSAGFMAILVSLEESYRKKADRETKTSQPKE